MCSANEAVDHGSNLNILIEVQTPKLKTRITITRQEIKSATKHKLICIYRLRHSSEG